MSNICPACEVGVLSATAGDRTINYKGNPIVVRGVQFAVCNVCAEEVVLAEYERPNERRYSDACREADGLLQSHEIVAFRERWGLTQAGAAAIFGGGVNAFSRYERGEVVQSQSTDLLIRVLDRISDARRFVSARTGVPLVRKLQKLDFTIHEAWESREEFDALVMVKSESYTAGGRKIRNALGLSSKDLLKTAGDSWQEVGGAYAKRA